MGLFSPYKRHANPFNYIPRYFDPEKERLIAESQGNLQLVYEFIADQLEQNEAGLTDLPELDYERVKKAVYVAH